MSNRRFGVHVCGGRFVLLITCFSLLSILIFGPVSSSSSSTYPAPLGPFPSFKLAFADDMMGMPSATTDATTDVPPGHEGGDEDDGGEDDMPATTDTITAGPSRGDGKDEDDDDENNGDDDNNSGNDNQEGQGSSIGPKAIDMGKCDPGYTYNDFGDCVAIATGGPENTGSATITPTTCPVSYSPYEKEFAVYPESYERKLITTTADMNYYSNKMSEHYKGSGHGVKPQLRFVDDSFLNYKNPVCQADKVDKKTGQITRTIKYQDGEKSIQSIRKSGEVYAQNDYNKQGKLTESSFTDYDGTKLTVDAQEGGTKVLQVQGTENEPNTAFTMTPQGDIKGETFGPATRGQYSSGKDIIGFTKMTDSTSGVTVKIDDLPKSLTGASGSKGIFVLDKNGYPIMQNSIMKKDGALMDLRDIPPRPLK